MLTCLNKNIGVVMPVKYKGILKIIFGIYTHCQQMVSKCISNLKSTVSVDNECKCQILSLISLMYICVGLGC